MESQYEEYLHKQIEGSTVLGERDLRQCVQSIEPPPDLSPENRYVCIFSCSFECICKIMRKSNKKISL